ncbi:hypothetical protein ALP75_200114 [Pseudomonas syringae pv. actinidiae]|nr:hypothetical protein ALP75_200114 [Pseudomonas syringae pv. actinidiae]
MGEQFGRFTTDRQHAFHAGLNGAFLIPIDRFFLVRQRQLRLQGCAHALGSRPGFTGQRHKPVNQCQVRNPLGQRACEQHRNDRTQRVPQQGKALPAELLGDLQHVKYVVGQGIGGTCRAMIGVAMPGQIQRDDPQTFQMRGQPGKTVGVVEPAVQRADRLAIFRAEQMGRQLDVPKVQAHFLDRQSHAPARCRCRASQRANSDLSNCAVSSGRSSGNMCPPGMDRYSPSRMRRAR